MTVGKKASLQVVIGGIFWGMLGTFVRELAAIGFDSLQIAFIRMLFAAVLFFIWLLVSDRSKLRISLKDVWMFLATGLACIFLHNITYFYAVIHGEAAVAIVLVYTSPIWVMLASALFFGEKITGRKLVALAVTFAGCVLMSGVAEGRASTSVKVALVGVFSGFLYGMYSIFSKIAFRKYSNETVNMYTFAFALVGSVFVIDLPSTMGLMLASSRNVLVCALASVLCCLIPFFLYTRGLKYMDASKAAILVSTDPLVSSALGFLVLGDDCTALKVIGICLVLSSIVILNSGDANNGKVLKKWRFHHVRYNHL